MSKRNSHADRDQHRVRHVVEIDAGRCSLCEVCARRCPSAALFVERGEGFLRLLFRPDLCTGCPGRQNCQDICPEEAIRLVSQEEAAGPATSPEALLLAKSGMLRCGYCGEYFAPVQKIDVISKRSGKSREPNREYCPLCRRTNMVIRFIDEKRMPTGKAEYRSSKDILRRARKRKEAEKKEGTP